MSATNTNEDVATIATVNILQADGNRKKSLFLQHKFGPCPIIAIANCLSLLEIGFLDADDINPETNTIDISVLIARLIEHVSNSNQSDDPNIQQNVSDVISTLSKSANGIDINVKFDDVKSFETTAVILLFDLLAIPLYHCWVVDPTDENVAPLIQSLTYNQVVDQIITLDSSESSSDDMIKVEFMRNFLNNNSTQMTSHGIQRLKETMLEDSYCVLFHNNHFSTITKHNDCLYTLTSSYAFEGRSGIVWESLDNTDGCGTFYDGSFNVFDCDAQNNTVQTRAQSKSSSKLQAIIEKLAILMMLSQRKRKSN